tara:strand:- start:1400 stop:2707 length:1308 start_codon:yes stop_codon:yes gene_type:complete
MAIALICSLSYSQGDTCAAASTVSCGTGEFDYISYTTSGFTDTAGNSSNDVFFTITPASVETINIDTCFTEGPRDTKIVVYSDCSLSTIVTQNDDGCVDLASVDFVADGVSTYIIMVEGGDDSLGAGGLEENGDFDMVVYCTPGQLPLPTPQGITCNAATSGASLLFSDELDAQGGWTGNIVTSGFGGTVNSGLWEIIDVTPGDTMDAVRGGCNSNQSGPSQQHSGATFMNYEATGSNNSATASAVSPAIDLTGTIVEDVELTFYLHAFGPGMGTLNVGIGTSVSGPFTNELTWTGDVQEASNDPWIQVGINLSSYLGQIIFIEFSNTGSGNFRGDMSIDKVEVIACDTVLDVENNEETIKGITLYPNPVRDYLNLRSIDQIEQISVYNLLGQQVRFSSPSNSQTSIDMTSLETGIYVVKIKAGGKTGNYKIIKE